MRSSPRAGSFIVIGLASIASATGALGCGSSASSGGGASTAGASSNAGSPGSGGSSAGKDSSAGSAGESAAGAPAGGSSSAGASTAGGANPSGGFTADDMPAVGTPGVDYLSDLTWKSAVVFSDFGAPGKDSPIGKDQTVNGKTPLIINGKSYAKGLGVKTYTEITYDLAGKYKQFVSDTGLDFQENAATMIFEVKLDGELVYDGGDKIANKTQMERVTLDVSGKSTLLLYVRDGFDDKTDDFGIWGGARLLK
jgi:hypothetical protein